MNKGKEKKIKRLRRHLKIKSKIFGTKERPRLCVFRSNKNIYVQLINDQAGETLVSAFSQEIKVNKKSKTEIAFEVGKLISAKANKKKINNVVFDRGGYKYHGRVKALADGAREGGLKF